MSVIAEPQYLEIGTVARSLGVASETIRAWERRKLISPPIRTASGKRLFTSEDVEAMRQAQHERRVSHESPVGAA